MRSAPPNSILTKTTSGHSACVKTAEYPEVLLIEDDTSYAKNFSNDSQRDIVGIRLHLIGRNGQQISTLDEQSYQKGTLSGQQGGRASIAMKMLDNVRSQHRRAIVVANSHYGANALFLQDLTRSGFSFAVEMPHDYCIVSRSSTLPKSSSQITDLLKTVTQVAVSLETPIATTLYTTADLGIQCLSSGISGRLFAFDTGAIGAIHRGTILGFSNIHRLGLVRLLQAIGWVRWFRILSRRIKRDSDCAETAGIYRKIECNQLPSMIPIRANITLAKTQDHRIIIPQQVSTATQGALTQTRNTLRVLELFAGAGGMGLGFQLARHNHHKFDVIYSAEINPIYVKTLNINYNHYRKQQNSGCSDRPDVASVDLSSRASVKTIATAVEAAGGVDVLIGGPPCQGFSNANRNSWASDNPNNKLVDVFLKYVDIFRPSVFLMENVQGILWTAKKNPRNPSASVVSYLAKRMATMGYLVFPKLLDAVWYGVPQYRSRFFLLGIHERLGYKSIDFGDWGPFPLPTHGPCTPNPFVTVKEAIGDLPVIGNGHTIELMPYDGKMLSPYAHRMRDGMDPCILSDHVTSKHAEYVLKRYRNIPPGGNWQSVSEMMTNYSDITRTHSNIYRRLSWNEPAITIGHYRKSMIVHPDQARGLSLREASRLQSFPDWFRFQGGLMHKQQQLANAVCPVVAQAIAEHLLRF